MIKIETFNAFKDAVKGLDLNSQLRISKVKNIGEEVELILKKKSKLPARTRHAIEEAARRAVLYLDNGAAV